jgi:hypothetical protein
MRQHRGSERRRIAARWLVGAAFEPGEQLAVGRRETGPEELDLLHVFVAERSGRGLGEPRRHADAQRAGDKLEQRPAPGLVELIEPARELRGQLRLAEHRDRRDHVGQRQLRIGTMVRIGRPHQRDGFRRVADIVARQAEQHRVNPLRDQRAQHIRLRILERQRTGERGERIATVGIGCVAEIVRHQPQLVVATGLIRQTVEQFGEALHGVAPVLPSVTPSLSSSSP